MFPRESAVPSTRRRASLSLRARPRTSTTGDSQIAMSNSCQDNSHIVESDYQRDIIGGHANLDTVDDADVLEETNIFPDPVPRRRGAKSFSNLRHPVNGLLALGRRLSVTIRSKSSKHNIRTPHDEPQQEQSYSKRHAPTGSWDARSRNAWAKAHSINRRPSLNSVSALESFYAPTGYIASPIPGNGLEPPVLPNDIYAGAAARAAAAAQNEQAKAERDALKIFESRLTLTRDSESGIGIDLRDRSELSDSELAVIRIGKYSPWTSNLPRTQP